MGMRLFQAKMTIVTLQQMATETDQMKYLSSTAEVLLSEYNEKMSLPHLVVAFDQKPKQRVRFQHMSDTCSLTWLSLSSKEGYL